MTVSLKHKFQSAIPDGNDPTQVRPSNWNDEHDLTLSSGNLLGRVSAGDGGVEELSNEQVRALLGEFASLADAQAYSPAAAPDYVRTAGYTSAGDGGGALYKRVVSGPSHAGKFQSADGTWWEIAEEIVTPQMFGAKADGVTDDYVAIMAAINSRVTGTGFYQSGAVVHFPDGVYRVSQTIELKKTTKLIGNSSGMPFDSRAALVFDPDTMGIVVNRHNTLNGGVEGSPTTAADASIIEGLKLAGSGSDISKHGIWLRARAVLRNLYVVQFPGNNINIVASAGIGGAAEGNANNWYAETIRTTGAGLHGFYVDGADVNAGVAILVDASGNGRYGIYDSSFLGNTYIACHTATNGLATAGKNPAGHSSFVHYGGMRYAAHPAASEADYVATTPGTDTNVWVPIIALGNHPTIPDWASGQPEGTYFAGGAYRTDNLNAANVFLGCYSESGQGASDLVGPVMALNGLIHSAGFTRGGYMRGDRGSVLTAKDGAFAVDGKTIDISVGGDEGAGTVLSFASVADTASWPWRLRRSGSDWVIDNASLSARIAMKLTGENTTEKMGTTAGVPYMAVFPRIALGSGFYVRRQTTGPAAPAAGEWSAGDICWNATPAIGNNAGWICTAAGTPGTWNPFGAISS